MQTFCFISQGLSHPPRPRGSQSGREKGRDESFKNGRKEKRKSLRLNKLLKLECF